MITHRTTRWGFAVLLAGSMTGCATSWPNSSASHTPDTPEARLVEAQRRQEKGEGGFSASVTRAAAAVQEALTIKPRVNEAEDPLSLANMPDEVSLDVYLAGGAMMESQGQLDRAKQQYERVLEAEPNHLLGLVSLARLSDRMGNSVEAEALYKQAVAAHPQSGLAHNDLGLFYARKHQPQEAVKMLAAAAALDPQNLRYGNNYAALLVEVGQYDRALGQLRKTSMPAEAHYNLGFLLHRNQQDQLARQHFAEAVRLNPELPQARAMLARLATAEDYQHRQTQAYQAAEQYEAAGRGYPRQQQPAWRQQDGQEVPQVAPAPQQEYLPYHAAGGPQTYTAGNAGVQQFPPMSQR